MLDVKDDNFVAVLPNSAVKGHGRRRASRYLNRGRATGTQLLFDS